MVFSAAGDEGDYDLDGVAVEVLATTVELHVHWQRQPRAVTAALRPCRPVDPWLYPVLLGSGKQVSADGTVPTALRLVESVTYPEGMLQLTYDTAGTPTYGQMGSPELTSE